MFRLKFFLLADLSYVNFFIQILFLLADLGYCEFLSICRKCDTIYAQFLKD